MAPNHLRPPSPVEEARVAFEEAGFAAVDVDYVQEVNLDDPSILTDNKGAPELFMLIFQSQDPLSTIRRERRRVALLARGMSGSRPEDVVLSLIGNQTFRVDWWYTHDDMHEADHVLGRISDMDAPMASALNDRLRSRRGWQSRVIKVPFPLEGTCRKYPHLEWARPEEQETCWLTFGIDSENSSYYQAQMTMVTAFEVAKDGADKRVRKGESFAVEDMRSAPAKTKSSRKSSRHRSRSSRRSRSRRPGSRSSSRGDNGSSRSRSKRASRSNLKKARSQDGCHHAARKSLHP